FTISDTQYGPFLPFLKQEIITDIDFNGQDLWIKDIYNKRTKITNPEIVKQLTQKNIDSFTTAVGNMIGSNLNVSTPVLEAETEDLRITLLHESIAATGTCVCIRKTPPVQRITPLSALENHYCTEEVLHLLVNCVKAKLNMVFCGEPGVGKTECAKFLTTFIPPDQKVVTVEDTRELRYREINPGKDCVELRVREGLFSYEDALKEVLRMNPNRVMLSEARSVEVKQLLECWTTGITGFTTLHTDDVRKIPDRILNMMPSIEDSERLTNDVYVGMDVGILLDTRYNRKTENIERYISQVAFFAREDHRNKNFILVRNGELTDTRIIPQDIIFRMEKAGIGDMFYSEELKQRLEKEKEEREKVEDFEKVF
ncbi:MAG: ATPase, T2SS/T4P/T4SS family, partial [Lachnospiraceae bacterium]